MSCPDWQSLCDRRDAGSGEVPGWHAALAHLEECSACESAALAADPTLLFRRLPVLEVDAGEVEAMQQAVTSMRRREVIENRRRTLPTSWLRAAAVGVALLGLALLRGASSTEPEHELASRDDFGGAHQLLALPDAVAAEELEDELSPASALPLVENIDPAYGQIIQVVDEEIAVVVVMQPSRDV